MTSVVVSTSGSAIALAIAVAASAASMMRLDFWASAMALRFPAVAAAAEISGTKAGVATRVGQQEDGSVRAAASPYSVRADITPMPLAKNARRPVRVFTSARVNASALTRNASTLKNVDS